MFSPVDASVQCIKKRYSIMNIRNFFLYCRASVILLVVIAVVVIGSPKLYWHIKISGIPFSVPSNLFPEAGMKDEEKKRAESKLTLYQTFILRVQSQNTIKNSLSILVFAELFDNLPTNLPATDT